MSYDDEYQQSVTLDDLLDDGRFAEAEEVLAAIGAEHPEETWVHSIRALCLSELGRDGEAIAAAAKAMRLEPGDAYARWVMGALLCDRNRLDDAMEQAREAVRLDPANPRVHALQAQIHAKRGEWAESRKHAERGLAIDPSDEVCASLRALALRPADSQEDWIAAVDELMQRYPASGWARAGKGWGLLETGRAGEAREHFEQALALDPTSQWAKRGLVESIKASNPIYAMLLRVFLWLDRLPPRTRWLYILGGLFVMRVMRGIARTNPELAPAAYPVIGLWIAFVVASWTAVPLSNFILSRTVLGRRLVTGDDLVAANTVAGLLAVALSASVVAFIGGSERVLIAALSAGFMIIPVSAIFQCSRGWPRTAMALYATVIAVVAVVGVMGSVEVGRTSAGIVVVMSVLGSWLGVFLASRIVASPMRTRQ